MLLPSQPPAPGQVVTLFYPRRNRHGQSLQLEKREVLVLEVIDGSVCPIELAAFLRRPRIKRGRHRLRAYDPRRLGERTFYLDWHSPTKLQLGRYSLLHPAGEGFDYEPIGEPFTQTRQGIAELVTTIEQLLKEPISPTAETTLGLFAA